MARLRIARSTTVRVAAAVAALAVTAPAGGSSATERAPSSKPRGVAELTCRAAHKLAGDSAVWQRVNGPQFEQPTGLAAVSQQIVAHAVDPANPDHLAVTNGNQIKVSFDGGCRWDPALRLDRVPSDPQRMPVSGQFTKILSLRITSKHTVYAMAEELSDSAVGRPHVLIGTDQGRQWSVGDTGLPTVGHPLALEASRDGEVLYATFQSARTQSSTTPCPPAPLPCPAPSSGEGTPGLLWASTDEGRTWERRTDPSDLNGAATIRYLSVDDDDRQGNLIWVVSNGLLRMSENGGRTFTAPDGLDQSGITYTAVESINQGDGFNPIEVVAFGTNHDMVRRERGRWKRSKVPFDTVESVTQRPEGDIIVATKPSGYPVSIYRIFGGDFHDYDEGNGLGGTTFKRTYGWELISPKAAITTDADVSAGDAGAPAGTFYAKDTRSVLRFIESKVRGNNTLGLPITLDRVVPPHGQISPRRYPKTLPPNGSVTVPYRLTLPPSPTPLDLYLLLDNSASMSTLIGDLKYNLADVVRKIHDTGIDVNVGVGQINTQPEEDKRPIDDVRTPDIDESLPKPLYERLRAIGPVDGELFTALNKVDGKGGGGDEAQIESLYQAVTGEGMDTSGLGLLLGYAVKPGQDAHFRTESHPIRVILHATDEVFSTNIKNGHSFAQAAQKLNEAGVYQIGLSNGSDEAHHDLQRMARATHAVAPPGGVDCDPEGELHLRAGEPLVCSNSTGLDTALLNVLNSIADPADIVLRHSASPVLRSMSREQIHINAKRATDVRFTVTYSCAGLPPGDYDAEVLAGLRGVEIGRTVAAITCDGPGGPQFRRPPAAGVVEPYQPQPAPQIQPLAPAPIAPVNPLPQVQAQPQAQVNTQAGAAQQDQEEIQVATAQNDIGTKRGDEDELAMSAVDHVPSGPPAGLVTLGAMALATACAGGVALRRRTRTAFARAQVRR